MKVVLPYNEQLTSKKQQVAEMFNNISYKYDFLNHFLSLGIDKVWRKKAIKIIKTKQHQTILDVATGTGDLAIEALKLHPEKIIGVDISEGMLSVGRDKLKKKGVDKKITLQYGDSESLPFQDNSFDIVMVAFGVRNFENLAKGLSEILRVLNKGGSVVILEFSKPRTFPFREIYHAYFKYILPFIGKFVSKDNRAYTYLPESVAQFPHGKEFIKILENNGFKFCQCKSLTLGISSIYTAEKHS